jgi:hypothetical protein
MPKRKNTNNDDNDNDDTSLTRENKRRKGLRGQILTNKNKNYRKHTDYPRFNNFGDPDFIDENNRQYRIAYQNDSIFYKNTIIGEKDKKELIQENDSFKLFIKIPKGSEWFNSTDRLEVTLYRRSDKILDFPIRIKIDNLFKLPRSKTGFVFVSGSDVKKLFQNK